MITKFTYTYLFIAIVFLSSSTFCLARNLSVNADLLIDTTVRKKLFLIIDYQHLKTNHLSRFNSGNLILAYQSSPNFTMGAGILYAYGKLHNDNGYNLRRIRLLPVFADFRYEFLPTHIVSPFLIADVGYSTFIKYRKIDPRHIEPSRNVYDSGIYTFGGCGLMFHINQHSTANIGTGFTGTHMSFNNNDVNPRGLTFRFGIKFNL